MKTVFTNGCFDLLHQGHVDLLRRARELGDRLVVGLNSDASVRSIKGNGRPVQSQEERAAILRSLRWVDEVIIYDEATPARVIEEIKPDVLVKGGDWQVSEIIGGDAVRRRGGQVVSLPLLPGYSTSSLMDRIRAQAGSHEARNGDLAGLTESIKVKQDLLTSCSEAILRCGGLLVDALKGGNKIMLFGNGGSAADAQHIAAEMTGRYLRTRTPLPAIALTTDTSALTSIGNDFGFERVFSRQVQALGRNGDAVVAISTSGTSHNVIQAAMEARSVGCTTVALTGASGKKLAGICDAAVLVPSLSTPRIQECHITIGHLWCEMIDAAVEPSQ